VLWSLLLINSVYNLDGFQSVYNLDAYGRYGAYGVLRRTLYNGSVVSLHVTHW
jgi:hypothetical protein